MRHFLSSPVLRPVAERPCSHRLRHCSCWLALGLLLLLAVRVVAAPYSGGRFTYRQPDGEAFSVRLWGDEFFAYQETEDGFLIVRDPRSGEFCYARVVKNGTDLVSTGVRVGKPVPQGLKAKQRLTPQAAMEKSRPLRAALGKDGRGRSLQAQADKAMPGRKEGIPADSTTQYAPGEDTGTSGETVVYAPPPSTTTGRRNGLVLLVYFPDFPADVTRTVADIDDFCNDETYTRDGNPCSVYKYFENQSGGKLIYKNIVTPWFAAANNRAYYTPAVTSPSYAQQLITEGLNRLQSQGFDFSQCDANGDGKIDGVNLFYAGARVNAWSQGLWPHQGGFSWSGFAAHGLNTSFQYQITDTPASLGIETFCHENGHMICDFPDLYDYYGTATEMGRFSLMSGSLAKAPPAIDPYLKIAAGWAQVTDLTSSSHQRCVVRVDNNHFYRYRNPAKTTEYFLFEARHNTGYEAHVGTDGISANPTSGVVIYQALQEGDNPDTTIYTGASPVNYSRPYELMVVEAAPTTGVTPWYTDPYPRTNDGFHAAGVNQVSDTTFPELKFWAADGRTVSSSAHVHSISSAGPVMSFTIGTGSLANPAELGVTLASIGAPIEAGTNANNRSFGIFNAGTGTINYTVSDDAAWLDASSASGSVTDAEVDEITVSFSTTGLGEGVHNATITVSATGIAGSPKTIPVSVTVLGTASAPSITTPPANAHLLGNASHNLTVAVSGSPVPTLQWYKDNVAVPGATSTTLTLSNITAAAAGSYHVVANNSQGQATSTAAVITVNDHPAITLVTPLVNELDLPAGVGLVLQTSVTDDGYGSSSLSYAWSVASAPPGAVVTWDNQNTTSTAARFSMNGDYVLRFAASDGTQSEITDFVVTSGATASGAVSNGNQIVHYRFNENPGETVAVDAAGGDQNGTMQNGAACSGGAVVLDGINDRVLLVNHADIDSASSLTKRTVAFWFKPDNVTGRKMLYEEGGGTNGISVYLNGNTLYFRIWGNITSYSASVTSLNIQAGQWHHAAFVLDTTQAITTNRFKTYLNGVPEDSISVYAIASHSDGGNPPCIGAVSGSSKYHDNFTPGTNDFFAGQIDDFRLYNRGLTAAEIGLLALRADNLGPAVDAGAATIGYPSTNIQIDGTVSDDGGPSVPGTVTTQWSVVSGPGGSSSFGNAASVDTTFTASNIGVHSMRLSADDGLVRTFDQSTCEIVDSTGPGVIRFQNATQPVAESAGTLQVEVVRPSGGITGAVSANYSVVNGTAVNGLDFAAASGTVSWADMESGTKTISIPIQGDSLLEGNETFSLVLNNPTGGAALSAPDSSVITITDDEATPVTVVANFAESGKAVPMAGGLYSTAGSLGTGVNSPFTFIYNLSGLGIGTATSLRITATTTGAQMTNGGGNGIAVNGGLNSNWWEASEGALSFAVSLRDASNADVTSQFDFDLTGVGMRWGELPSPTLTVAGQTSGWTAVNQTIDLPIGQTNESTFQVSRTENTIGQFQQVRLAIVRKPAFSNPFSSYVAALPAGSRAIDSDPDGDGLRNGIEAVFGTSPSTSNGAMVQTGPVTGNRFTLTHPRNPDLPGDISPYYLWSLNLTDWYECDGTDGPAGGPTCTIGTETTGGTTTVTATFSEAQPRVFMVLGVQPN